MKKGLFFLLTCFTLNAFSQSTYTISGYVKDSLTGEDLIGATVFIENEAVMSNSYGFYSLTMSEGKYRVTAAYLGYEDKERSVFLNKNVTLDFLMSTTSIIVDGVKVVAEKSEYYSECKTLSPQKIKETPTVFGEPDVLKVMQNQPGIKNVSDGSSAIYVRGGNRDQNLMLIDEASIYNVSHMYGYVSTFNPSMLKSVQFYNSYIPAEFGGRISAVLDTKLKEGNLQKFESEFSISPLTVNGSIQGPFKKDTASFFVSVRKSVYDVILNHFSEYSHYPSFYDLNTKANWKINDKNRIFISSYFGKDIFSKADFTRDQLNFTTTFRWQKIITPKLFVNTSYVYNTYFNHSTITNTTGDSYWNTGVSDNGLKTKFTWYINSKNKIEYGLQTTYHQIIPGETAVKEESISRINLLESGAYASHTIIINPSFELNYGVRYSLYQNSGSAFWYSLDNLYNPISKNFETGFAWNSSGFIEPRVVLEYKRNTNKFSISYTRTSQAMQVLSNNAYSYSSIETWIASDPTLEPLQSSNYAIAYSLNNEKFGTLIEVYYRDIINQIDYVDHAQLFSNPTVVAELRSGSAKAYGVELSVEKKFEKALLKASYSYARVLYTIPDVTSVTTYRAPYDMPHDFKTSYVFPIKKRMTVSLFWVLTSGRPTTIPRGYFYYKNEYVPIYGERNGDSFPLYHRLDLSAKYTFKEKEKFTHSLSLSVFNAYGRFNPLSYNYYPIVNEVAVEYFNDFLPSFNYQITFK